VRAEVDREAVPQERERHQAADSERQEQGQHEQHRVDQPEKVGRLLGALADHGRDSNAATGSRERGVVVTQPCDGLFDDSDRERSVCSSLLDGTS